MVLHDTAFGVALCATLGLGGWLGYRVLGRILASEYVTIDNAPKLLEIGNLSSWNAFRLANRTWRPALRGIDLAGKTLRDADLTSCDMTNARLDGAVLDGADLSDAILDGASLAGASAIGTVFDRASITATKFKGAIVRGASFAGTIGEASDLAQTRLDRTAAEPSTTDSQQWLAELTPAQFVKFVRTVLLHNDYTVEESGKGDLGGDLVVRRKDIAGATDEIVETKRLSSPGRRIDLQLLMQLEAARNHCRAQGAYFVTNGQFSDAARAFADARPGLKLVDGPRLQELSKGLGLSKKDFTEQP